METKTEYELLRERRDAVYEEMNDKSKYTVKKKCFICGGMANPTKSFDYYCAHGNCCLNCISRINARLRPNRYDSLRKTHPELF